ncbi:acyl transferase [Lactobacillus sp. CBA3605]|uniref:acyltransferase domain-containing protein n=1 Tax=Lactobacillus sp. CBA3605 TaxID=2099788 RepID=UPI000CFC5842|nr:acyltransferase domain-containing protein [Lactobacillus sp. CBA3605]AVK62093.1 acyl transferase [Lactobacillus sp. CBA3605]
MQALWVFPGQGSQRAGMLATVPAALKQRVTELTGLTLADTAAAYEDAVQIQLGILVLQLAQLQQLQALDVQPQAVAGHSLGVFAAAVAAKVITIDTAINLVYLRATAMQAAYPTGYGMGVVVGLTRIELQSIVTQVQIRYPAVYLSNQNTALQNTVSGVLEGIRQVLKLALAQGAQHAKLLQVPVPSHSPLMAGVAQQLTQALATKQLATPQCPYLTNWNGHRVRDAAGVAFDLANNLRYPVYWDTMIAIGQESGLNVSLEFGPGQVFTKLIKTYQPTIRTLNLAAMSVDDVEFLLNKWKEVL